MKSMDFSGYVLSSCIAVAMLAGCDGSQPPIGAPGVMQPRTTHRSGVAQKTDLLYVASYSHSFPYVYLLSYPQGQLVGKIDEQVTGLCSDAHGNVYMTQPSNSTSTVYEYAHAAKKPLATLSDPYNGAYGCAVDPTSGNLAVANSTSKTVVIYLRARGKPQTYHLWFEPNYVAYDPKKHLYAIGSEGGWFAQLDDGKFRRVHLNRHVEYPIGAQWDGTYLALGNAGNSYSPGAIRQYAIAGLNGIQEGYTRLSTFVNQFCIDGPTIVLSDSGGDHIYFVAYPGGGEPTKTIGINTPGSVTISVAPSR